MEEFRAAGHPDRTIDVGASPSSIAPAGAPAAPPQLHRALRPWQHLGSAVAATGTDSGRASQGESGRATPAGWTPVLRSLPSAWSGRTGGAVTPFPMSSAPILHGGGPAAARAVASAAPLARRETPPAALAAGGAFDVVRPRAVLPRGVQRLTSLPGVGAIPVPPAPSHAVALGAAGGPRGVSPVATRRPIAGLPGAASQAADSGRSGVTSGAAALDRPGLRRTAAVQPTQAPAGRREGAAAVQPTQAPVGQLRGAAAVQLTQATVGQLRGDAAVHRTPAPGQVRGGDAAVHRTPAPARRAPGVLRALGTSALVPPDGAAAVAATINRHLTPLVHGLRPDLRPGVPSAGYGSLGHAHPGRPAPAPSGGRAPVAGSGGSVRDAAGGAAVGGAAAGPAHTLRRTAAAGSGPVRATPAARRSAPGGTGAGQVPGAPAERFHRVLRNRQPDRRAPLPGRLRPLAAAIAGPTSIEVAAGPASRAALAAAGHRAATVNRTIHLTAPPDRVPVEVIAHELVHASRPSPSVRFFGDHRHTGEERHATAVGRLARSMRPADSGAVDTAALARLPVGGPQLFAAGGASRPAPTVTDAARSAVQRRPGRDTSTADFARTAGLSPALTDLLVAPPRRGGTTAAPSPVGALAERAAGFASLLDGAGGPAGDPAPSPGGRFPAPMSPSHVSPGAAMTERSHPLSTHSRGPIDSEIIEWIVEAVETRVLEELERRGLRFQPGVF